MTSEDATQAARREVRDFFNGSGAYNGAPWGEDDVEIVKLFLERNHVVRIPEEGLLEVTRDGNMIKVNGENFLSNPDQFDMQRLVRNDAEAIEASGNLLREAVLHHEKAKAVQAFLAQEQEAAKQTELAREKRLEELSHEFFGIPYRQATGTAAHRLLDRIVDLEMAAAS